MDLLLLGWVEKTINENFRAQWLVQKVILTVFWDMKETYAIDFFEKIQM